MDHIHLYLGLLCDLRELAISERMVAAGREQHATDQKIQLDLDRVSREIETKKAQVYEDLFWIPRSN